MVFLIAAIYSVHQHYRRRQLQKQQELSFKQSASQVKMEDERPHVRRAWISHVFENSAESNKTTFCLATRPDEKLGLTVRRLALGAFCAGVSDEARAAGVVEGSILCKVQGQAVLAEPTKQLVALLDVYKSNMTGPVVLEFVHADSDREYTVCLWTRQWGISWGTCGNFALLQRVYGHAATAGIVKGTLLGVVQGQAFLDHAAATDTLRQAWSTPDDTLQITCLLPPQNTRTLRPQTPLPMQRPVRTTQSDDGVQVRFYGWGESLCQPWPESKTNDSVLLPYSTSLPVLEPGAILQVNPLIESLLYCLRMNKAKYIDIKTHESWQELLQSPKIAKVFLLPLLSVVCAPEMKEASDVTSLLLKLSRKDEEFCQRLYFLLRSYISTFETRRPATFGRDPGDTSQNLLALLHCLELLRFAEKELANRIPPAISDSHSNDSSASPTPISPEEKPKRVFFWRKKKNKATSRQQQVHQQQQLPLTPIKAVIPVASATPSPVQDDTLTQSPSVMYDNMSDFLGELDSICGTIERSLQKSFRQKIADWAMQPWSASKDTALAQVTHTMRRSLQESREQTLLVNPVDSTELLSSVDYNECYILPSAHFPILLTFNVSERRCADNVVEQLYQTCVQVISISGLDESCVVHAAVAGTMEATGPAKRSFKGCHDVLTFSTRSTTGAPETLSLRVSSDITTAFGWVDLKPLWQDKQGLDTYASVGVYELEHVQLDEEGQLICTRQPIQLKLKITVDCVYNFDSHRKRMLLYKHDDDLRQEAFAIDFIQTCDSILKAAGLDMKLLTFQCIPVGTRRGFVEWVNGSVPLSEICQPFAGSILDNNNNMANLERKNGLHENVSDPSMISKAGLTKYESLRRLGGQQNDSLRRLGASSSSEFLRGSFANNPIQDYLRSVAYDVGSPLMIRRSVMDTYVKSCAGYCVITYILGVGDRHLDNLLLHQSGAFFHCDFSFILGSDPKKQMPMRVTEDMVYGMGGRDDDNFAKFLSLAGAAFLALRRPENVRLLLSLVRIMEPSFLPDVSENQSTEVAMLGMRDRLRLDLNEIEAVAYMEELIESSISNKLWIAVDAIHNLAKITRH